uniref:Small EDRK-rich factor 2 n=1 Tax=Moschus moschiferus TaxID=68415 RepID=A0A8C6DFD6_MOSMO
MKKQSDSVKGKRRDDGLSAAARKQRLWFQAIDCFPLTR